MSSKTKVVRMMFNENLWNSSRALRYVKNNGYTTTKRGVKKNGWLIYQIKKESEYENFRTTTIDKQRKIRVILGTKKTQTIETVVETVVETIETIETVVEPVEEPAQ